MALSSRTSSTDMSRLPSDLPDNQYYSGGSKPEGRQRLPGARLPLRMRIQSLTSTVLRRRKSLVADDATTIRSSYYTNDGYYPASFYESAPKKKSSFLSSLKYSMRGASIGDNGNSERNMAKQEMYIWSWHFMPGAPYRDSTKLCRSVSRSVGRRRGLRVHTPSTTTTATSLVKVSSVPEDSKEIVEWARVHGVLHYIDIFLDPDDIAKAPTAPIVEDVECFDSMDVMSDMTEIRQSTSDCTVERVDGQNPEMENQLRVCAEQEQNKKGQFVWLLYPYRCNNRRMTRDVRKKKQPQTKACKTSSLAQERGEWLKRMRSLGSYLVVDGTDCMREAEKERRTLLGWEVPSDSSSEEPASLNNEGSSEAIALNSGGPCTDAESSVVKGECGLQPRKWVDRPQGMSDNGTTPAALSNDAEVQDDITSDPKWIQCAGIFGISIHHTGHVLLHRNGGRRTLRLNQLRRIVVGLTEESRKETLSAISGMVRFHESDKLRPKESRKPIAASLFSCIRTVLWNPGTKHCDSKSLVSDRLDQEVAEKEYNLLLNYYKRNLSRPRHGNAVAPANRTMFEDPRPRLDVVHEDAAEICDDLESVEQMASYQYIQRKVVSHPERPLKEVEITAQQESVVKAAMAMGKSSVDGMPLCGEELYASHKLCELIQPNARRNEGMGLPRHLPRRLPHPLPRRLPFVERSQSCMERGGEKDLVHGSISVSVGHQHPTNDEDGAEDSHVIDESVYGSEELELNLDHAVTLHFTSTCVPLILVAPNSNIRDALVTTLCSMQCYLHLTPAAVHDVTGRHFFPPSLHHITSVGIRWNRFHNFGGLSLLAHKLATPQRAKGEHRATPTGQVWKGHSPMFAKAHTSAHW